MKIKSKTKMKSTVKLIHGHSLKVLRKAKSNSVDTIITDPPYGISFMGKKWDYDVPSVELWAECLRVLKPGGTALIFAGSRTQHRMAVNVEEAGFDIKDTIMWIYGSGFPKATDVSKQLDKMDAVTAQKARQLKFTEWVRAQGITASQINTATNTNMGGHYTTLASQRAVMTRKHLEMCSHLFNKIPQWVLDECDKRSIESKNFAEREIIGQSKHKPGIATKAEGHYNTVGGTEAKHVNITEPTTPEAKEWNGWKSHGLKPAYEPIIVAVKPNEGTYAENALKWGVSGLNIEGGRVGTQEYTQDQWNKKEESRIGGLSFSGGKPSKSIMPTGRFPSNIILDEEAGEMLDEQSNEDNPSRFFYCAKASKSERNAGCEGLEEITDSEMTSRKEGSSGLDWNDGKGGNAFAGASSSRGTNRKNNHPTVKPLKLMEYLCILTKTPTGGRVLDPFMGSGTTGVACVNTGRRFIGIDKELEFVVIAKHRTQHAINKVEKHKKLTDSYLI